MYCKSGADNLNLFDGFEENDSICGLYDTLETGLANAMTYLALGQIRKCLSVLSSVQRQYAEFNDILVVYAGNELGIRIENAIGAARGLKFHGTASPALSFEQSELSLAA